MPVQEPPDQVRTGLDEWMPFADDLEPDELLGLLGWGLSDPRLDPDTVRREHLIDERHISRAERWATEHLRTALRHYCDIKGRTSTQTIAKAMAAAATPIGLVAMFGVWPGAVVAVSAFFLKANADRWCEKYGPFALDGPARYTVGEQSDGEEVLTLYPGLAALVWNPPIEEFVNSRHHGIKRTRIRLYQAGEGKGNFVPKASDPRPIVATILNPGPKPGINHRIEFNDVASKHAVNSPIESVESRKPGVLGFTIREQKDMPTRSP